MSDYADIAKRAVACKHWRWMPGMADKRGWRATDCGHGQIAWTQEQDLLELGACGDLPDLDDPATLGCLLALVREAWAGRGVSVVVYGDDDCMVRIVPPTFSHTFGAKFTGTIEAALVAALEAAPC